MIIYVLGAGKSSYYLLDYLSRYEVNHDRKLTVLDLKVDDDLRQEFKDIQFLEGDMHCDESIANFEKAKVVVSFLPAVMHPKVAVLCLEHHCHLVTASYVSEKMATFHEEASKRGLCFMMEMGLDPGIDHMSAMEMIDHIKSDGYQIKSFKSYCGALVAKDSDDNPWHYKFTWNPMNVVLAGQTVAGYIDGGKKKYLSSFNVFNETQTIETPQGIFDGYYNRDSIAYREKYGLTECNTFIRGTLRGEGFCEAWQVLIDLGFTHHKTELDFSGLTINQVFSSFILQRNQCDDFWESLRKQVGNFTKRTEENLRYLGIESNEILPIQKASAAQYLLHILLEKWQLKEGDRDRIVLFHEIKAIKNNTERIFKAVLDLEGADEHKTAIARTVSLPAAIGATLLVEDKISLKGVHIPIAKEVYQPILKQLAELGIKLTEL